MMIDRRALLISAAALAVPFSACRPAQAASLPAPVTDQTPAPTGSQTIVLAGGCFWGVQGVFQRVKGVRSATSGYCGGAADTAQYEVVGTGQTGHAESVEVVFDPKVISLGHILQIFFAVATDPTQLNMQFPDHGTQYRNEIFCRNEAQAKVARAYIAQLDAAHVFPSKIVTKVSVGKTFYDAEAYHQDYLTLHPTQGYIAAYDIPKVKALQAMFPADYRATPLRTAL